MSINPILIRNINKNQPNFTSNNSVSDLQDKLKSLNFQKSRLISALNNLNNSDCSEENKMSLEFQISELLLHIDYIKRSLQQKTKQNNEPQKQNYMQQLLFECGDVNDGDFSQIEMDAEILIADCYRKIGIEPLGRDLVVMTQKPKITKKVPFAEGDKQLQLDEYQQSAVNLFKEGNSVMVTAPTGTGKTLIAEHIIDDILKQGKKVIYTTPLKALCNDKYNQFSILWGDYKDGKLVGKSKVGLVTGDAKINTDAPLLVMTTEVYRNLVVEKSKSDAEKSLKDVDAVILDEFHYMGDTSRGSVWEEALMFSPPNKRYLMLSATVSNAEDLNKWLNKIQPEQKSVIVSVPEEERHVPLKHFVYSKMGNMYGFYDLIDEKIDLNELSQKKLCKREQEVISEIGKLFNSDDGLKILRKIFTMYSQQNGLKISSDKFIAELVKNNVPYQKAEQYALRLADKKSKKISPKLSKMQPIEEIPMTYLVRELARKKMMPALYFVYSKKNCKTLMQDASRNIGQLLTKDEYFEVQKRINRMEQKGIFLGVDFEDTIKPCLLNGFAMHHSGMLPQCKSFIEDLGRRKLVKVCFATDTLGAGINFPFKTVIFSDFEKYGDMGFEEISTNSFKQGAGRAGRRGIDDIGYVISIPKEKEEAAIPYNKIVNDSDDIESAFKLSYGLILSPRFLNHSEEIINKSFYSYQTDESDHTLQQCESMKSVLKDRGFLEEKNNILRLTPKGKIASRIRGINELLLAELITNNDIVQNISPSELAALISIFAPVKEEKIKSVEDLSENNKKKVEIAIKTAENIRNQETQHGINSNIMIDTSTLPYIKMWAEMKSENNILLWSNIIRDAIQSKAIADEGDFLKKINFTTDVLKKLQNVAPTDYLKETAQKAVKMLQKSPVNDILLCELDYKDNE